MRSRAEVIDRLEKTMQAKLVAVKTNDRRSIARATEWERCLQWVLSGYEKSDDLSPSLDDVAELQIKKGRS